MTCYGTRARSDTPAAAASPLPDDARDIELSLSDPARFGVIFDRYFSEIYGYAAKRAGRSAADDVAAETFLTAFWARRRFDPGRGTVKAWLYGIVTNQLSAYRRNGSYAAVFTAPPGARVTLRTSARDAARGSVTETITSAYQVTG